MSDVSYFETQPHAALREAVRCVWVYAPDDVDTTPQRIPPDGCSELVIHFGAPYVRIEGGAEIAHPRMLFAGQITRPLVVRATGPFAVLGVRFEPDGARGFIGRALCGVTDTRIDLVSGCDGACAKGQRAMALLKDVTTLDDWNARMDAAQHYVAAVMATNAVEIDQDLRAMVRHLEHGAHLGDCALSPRQMQRRFADRVGVPAQTLAAIFRFRRVFDEIERGQPARWIEAALGAGYFDQPQMARDFRRFLGCTASDWARQKLGLATALAGRQASRSYKPERPHAG